MKSISDIGKTMLEFQEKLAAERKYAPIEIDFFLGDVREKYFNVLPEWCNLTGDPLAHLFSLAGTLLCNGYQRIVIGDYGAFIEIRPDQINKEKLMYKKGQEYRLKDPRYSKNIKYLWLTLNDRSDCKIYLQRKKVDYADYVPGMYYISPYEVEYKKNKI